VKKYKNLLLAIDIGLKKRDLMVINLSEDELKLRNANHQMLQLTSYSSETESKWMIVAQAGVGGELLLHFNQFMGRLNEAIKLQQAIVEIAVIKLQKARGDVLAAEYMNKSLKMILTKKQAMASLISKRQDQKLMDEFSSARPASAKDIF